MSPSGHFVKHVGIERPDADIGSHPAVHRALTGCDDGAPYNPLRRTSDFGTGAAKDCSKNSCAPLRYFAYLL